MERITRFACFSVKPVANDSLYGVKLPFQGVVFLMEKTISVLEYFAEGCGIRKTGCLEGVSKDTVFRLDKIAGAHAKVLHDELVRELALDEVQFDEKGSFVGEKEKRLSKGEKARGDQWDHVSFASKKKLVVSMLPGKRTEENTKGLIEDFSLRVNNGRPPA